MPTPKPLRRAKIAPSRVDDRSFSLPLRKILTFLLILVPFAIVFQLRNAIPAAQEGTTTETLKGDPQSDCEWRLQKLQQQLTDVTRKYNNMYCEKNGIGPTGGFCLSKEQVSVGGNDHLDKKVAEYLAQNVFTGSTVGDLGAGIGQYTKLFKTFNISSYAFDGAANVDEVTDGAVLYRDLSKPLLAVPMHKWNPGNTDELPVFDWIMSLVRSYVID
jgi:hypothetical protein